MRPILSTHSLYTTYIPRSSEAKDVNKVGFCSGPGGFRTRIVNEKMKPGLLMRR